MVDFIEFVDGPSGEVVSLEVWADVPDFQRLVGEQPVARVVRWERAVQEFAADGQLLRSSTLQA